MKEHVFGVVAASVLLVGLVLYPHAGIGADRPVQGHPLLSVGKPGPNAIDLKITSAKPASDGSGKEEPPVIQLEAAAEAHLVALYVSSEGDVILVFPNKESAGQPLVSGQQYTLFGPDSQVQLKKSNRVKDAKIVFFVSSKPFQLDPLTIPEGEFFLTIPHASVEAQDVLRKKLEEMSTDGGFNRKVIELETPLKPIIRLNVMGVGDKVTSRKPGTLTGSQGVTEKPDSQ